MGRFLFGLLFVYTAVDCIELGSHGTALVLSVLGLPLMVWGAVTMRRQHQTYYRED